jgi:hypothetical protein
MIGYVVAVGRAKVDTVHYASQSHRPSRRRRSAPGGAAARCPLLRVLDDTGFDRVMHYPPDTMQFTAYVCAAAHKVLFVCTKGPACTPDPAFLTAAAAWILDNTAVCARAPPSPRERGGARPHVPPDAGDGREARAEQRLQPDGTGAAIGPAHPRPPRPRRHINAWCDTLIDALTAHHVRRTLGRDDGA